MTSSPPRPSPDLLLPLLLLLLLLRGSAALIACASGGSQVRAEDAEEAAEEVDAHQDEDERLPVTESDLSARPQHGHGLWAPGPLPPEATAPGVLSGPPSDSPARAPGPQ
eukprot:760170-Hanusia_phi.AAC.1